MESNDDGEEKSGDDGSQESDSDGGSGCEESRGHTQIPQILPLYEKKGTGECMNQSIKYYRVYDKLVHIY
jgi:hypothetical protein